MANNAVKLHIAEHGLISTIETLIASPEKLDMNGSNAAARLRLVARVLTMTEAATKSLAWDAEVLEALTVGSQVS